MSTSRTQHLPHQLWGIYHADPEYARALDDPLRTVVQAFSQIAAEENAARLGFSDPTAKLVRPEEVQRAQWLPQRRPGHRQEIVRQSVQGSRR